MLMWGMREGSSHITWKVCNRTKIWYLGIQVQGRVVLFHSPVNTHTNQDYTLFIFILSIFGCCLALVSVPRIPNCWFISNLFVHQVAFSCLVPLNQVSKIDSFPLFWVLMIFFLRIISDFYFGTWASQGDRARWSTLKIVKISLFLGLGSATRVQNFSFSLGIQFFTSRSKIFYVA